MAQPSIPASDVVWIEDEWTNPWDREEYPSGPPSYLSWPVDESQRVSGVASFPDVDSGVAGPWSPDLNAIFPQPLPLDPSRPIVAYVLLADCGPPPGALGVEIQLDRGPIRYYWGEPILWQEELYAGSPAAVRVGDVPPAGQWHRLEMSTSHLQGQASITGLQLLSSGSGSSYDAPAVWWDHIGLGAPRHLALHEVVPPRGAASGGTPVRLLGTGFADGPATVRFGTAAATSVTFVSATELTATAPAGTGTVDVEVTTAAQTSVLANAFTYFAAPSIASVEPRKGSAGGGESVTVYGTELVPDFTAVGFGGNAAPEVEVLSPNSLRATTPPNLPGSVDVHVTTPGGTTSANGAFTYFTAPAIQSFAPSAGRAGSAVILSGSSFDSDPAGNAVRFGAVAATVRSASSTEVSVAVPPGATTAPISVTTAGGTATSAANFQVLTVTQFAVTPRSITLNAGETAPLSAVVTLSDGSTETLTAGGAWGTSNASVASVDASGGVRGVAPGTATITASFETFSSSATVTVEAREPLPPDPATIATPLDPTVAASFADSIRFLYTSNPPVQRDVLAGAIVDERAAVVRGIVTDRDLRPLAGVRVDVAGAPRLGSTLTRADGAYDIAVNGGGSVTLAFSRSGYLPAQRQIKPRWNAYVVADPVALVPLDPAATTIAGGAATMQVARASTVSDADGARTATMLFPAGTTASMVLPDGTSSALATLNVRATEYSVGPQGPRAMPAELPPQSGYTYCAELSVDEALAAGAERVQFSKPVVFYVDNFLEFPVGTTVPVGYYDRVGAVWVPSDSGRVVKVVSVTGASADLDLDGDGTAESTATLEQNGITTDERAQLATLYTAGRTLWRATIDHFTPIDLNWPVNAKPAVDSPEPPPYGTGPQTDVNPDDVCTIGGSIIECQSQVLGESIPITGTGLTLEYRSSRVPGRIAARHVDVVMTTSYVPSGVREVKLSISAAGKKIERSFSPSPNIRTSFTWDGRDAYGRLLQGAQALDVKVTYVYPSVYVSTNRFASYPDGVTLAPGRTELHWSRERTVTLRPWDARSAGLGGWMLSEHRVLDRAGNVAYDGDGSKRSGDDVAGAITTIAGVGACSTNCRHPNPFVPIPATQAFLQTPRGVAAAPDGTIYIVAGVHVYRLAGDGILRIAGNGSNDWNGGGNGGPALQAGFYGPWGIALGTDGSMYVTEPERARVRRISPQGIVTLFAGGNEPGYSGDGGPAVNAKLTWPTSIAVAADGAVYVSEHTVGRIRRITTDGRISTVAGAGSSAIAEGARATAVALDAYTEIAVGQDGSLYLAGRAVWRLDSDGRLRSVAAPLCGAAGAPACKPFTNPAAVGMTAGHGGELYVAELYDDTFSVRRIDADGTVTVVAQGRNGNPFQSFPPQHIYFSGEGGQATAAGYAMPKAIAIGPDGGLLIADYGNYRVRRVTSTLGRRRGAELLVASPAHGDVGVFDEHGRHLRTIDPSTGALRASFAYDAAGRLASISDASGNRTVIERNADGTIAIVAAGGQRTLLATDSNGYLSSVRNPAGETTHLATTADGLLRGLTKPTGVSYSFSYDTLGRLGTDSDPAGGSKNLSLTRTGLDYTVTVRSGLGRETTYKHQTLVGGQLRKTFISASGTSSVTEIERSRRTVHTSPDGSVTTAETSPDPQFGMELPFVSKATLRTPAGKVATLSATRSVTGMSANDPFSFTTATEAATINGKTWTTTYDPLQRRITARTPSGRTATLDLDAAGRVTGITVPGAASVSATYDARGLLTAASQGGRSATYDYDSALRLIAASDPSGRTAHFGYDAAGRLTSQTVDQRTVEFFYDPDGNLSAVKPANRERHDFAFTPIGLVSSYTPPSGDGVTSYTWNADRQLTGLRRGGFAITLGYDAGGRLSTIAHPDRTTTLGYSAGGNIASVVAGDQSLAYSYDGFLLTGTSYSGAVNGSLGWSYDTDFRLASESVDGAPVTFGYDTDGLLVRAGALDLRRDPASGLLTAVEMGPMRESFTYDSFSQVAGVATTAGTTPLLSFTYTRDAAGRIVGIAESSASGAQVTRGYEYDASGRLVRVTDGTTAVAEYDYDTNGNRMAHRYVGGTSTATYDGDDRLLTYGGTTYEYTASGELRARTTAGETTFFTYDAMGNLLRVGGTGLAIEYIVDGRNRRIGKKVAGVLTQAWLYADQYRIVAEFDGTGTVTSRFVYGSRMNVPDSMIRGGVTYRILSDHLGSPRLVVNTTNNTIAQALTYDEFGNVLTDTNPGFQPFGFAGGLYDRDTRLVRFGARDYDPHTGRWTAKDPILFDASGMNVYEYALGDPVNLFDPTGLDAITADPHNLERFLDLFEKGGSGFKETERSAFITQSGDDTSCELWPWTAGYRTETFRGQRPPGTVAVAHTHPNTADPQPSDGDERSANRAGLPFYTVTRKGIYKYDPSTQRTTQEEDSGWIKRAQKTRSTHKQENATPCSCTQLQ